MAARYLRYGIRALLGALVFAWVGQAVAPAAATLAPPAGGGTVENNCTDYWSPPFTEEAYFYPELNATYWFWRYDGDDPSAQNVAFRLQGLYPYARNSSYHFYPTLNGGSADNSLRDTFILPDEGSVNPYLPGVDRHAPNRSFSLWIVPWDSQRVGQPNTLVSTPDTEYPTFMLRVYRPDAGFEDGGVPLPTIEAFDDDTGEPVPCPPILDAVPPIPVDPDLGPPADSLVSFYRSGGDGYYPNDDNKYLVARLAPRTFGRILIVRLYPPTFLDTYENPEAVFTGDEEVRYMSLCMGGQISTRTSECIADDEFLLNQDGFFNVVVGPDSTFLRSLAAARGYNYMVWYNLTNPMLLYRQMVPHPDFSGSIANVPHYDPEQPAAGQEAQNFIGDYAPYGRYCSITAFVGGSDCGMPTPQPLVSVP